MAYHWTFGKDPLKLGKICEWSTINVCNDGPSEKILCRNFRKLSPLVESYIMEEVRLRSSEMFKDGYLKNIFPDEALLWILFDIWE